MAKADVFKFELLDGSFFEVPKAPKGRTTVVRFFDGSTVRVDHKGNIIRKKGRHAPKSKMNIIINYWGASGAGAPLKSNRAMNADTAIDRAFSHMRANDYEAFVAEVFNEVTGELLAVLTHSVVGEIRTMFHYDSKNKTYVQGFEQKAQEEAKLAVAEAKRQEEAALSTMDHISRIMQLPAPETNKQ